MPKHVRFSMSDTFETNPQGFIAYLEGQIIALAESVADLKVANIRLEEQVEQLEDRCNKKEIKIDNIMTNIIPALQQWQSGASGYARGIAASAGAVGFLLAYVFYKFVK